MVQGNEKRKRTRCGIPGCTFSGVNLNRHFKSVHSDLKPAVDKRVAGSGFAPGEKFSSWCQGSLVSFVPELNLKCYFPCLGIHFWQPVFKVKSVNGLDKSH